MLKRLLSIVLALVAAHVQAHDASLGVHGMVLFGGKQGLYAAHLPMFHAPHDVQVVLRVHFADRRLDHAIRHRLDARTALWTLDPERFELSRLGPSSTRPLAGLSANVVQGHFEQGGRIRYRQAQLKVDEVVLYRPLHSDMVARANATYAPVGQFLVKLIDSRPDFDHIVRLRTAAAAAVTVPKSGLTANVQALGRQFQVVGTVYWSAEDLR